MKTDPMEHQKTGVRLLDEHPEIYAIAAEQGTGKTWMLMAEMEKRWLAGDINGGFIVAPKGVHTNWVRREMPKHWSEEVDMQRYLSSMGVRDMRKIEKLCKPNGKFQLLTMNIDAVNTNRGLAVAQEFLRNHDAVMTIDESHHIKSPKSKRTQRCIDLGKLAAARRISTGTMMDTPPDIFSQFEFLKPEGKLLGTDSYRAFVAEFADVLPDHHPLVRNIMEKQLAARGRAFTPQVIRTDAKGRKIWRNIDKLQALMAPHVFRVLKKDCMDLPEKIYQTRYFELAPAQRKVYDKIKNSLRYEAEGDLHTFNALTKGTKLQQVTSGFIMIDNEPHGLMEKNPRMELLEAVIEDVSNNKPFIIWAVYREELRLIEEMMRRMGITSVSYHGGIKDKTRDENVDRFMAGDAQAMIANPAAGGEGLDMYIAELAIYYSHTYKLIKRKQSEDRNHRNGLRGDAVYIDLCAEGTIDENIAAAQQAKSDVSEAIMDAIKA